MECKQFAHDFFSMVRDQNSKVLTDHEEWLLREYSKLMKREIEVKKREEEVKKREEDCKKKSANQNL